MRKWIAMVALLLVCAFSAAAATSSQLSEVEQLRVEKAQLLATIASLTADRALWRVNFAQCSELLGRKEAEAATSAANAFTHLLLNEIEWAHPGFTLDPKGMLIPREK